MNSVVKHWVRAKPLRHSVASNPASSRKTLARRKPRCRAIGLRHTAPMFTPALHATVPAPRGLLDPWRTWRGTLAMAVLMWLCFVLFWWAISGFKLGRLVRTGPWELTFLGLGCLFIHAFIHRGRSLWPQEPTVAQVVFGGFWLSGIIIGLGGFFQFLTPSWVYPRTGGFTHASNGWMLSAVFSPPWFVLVLASLDMRLSALEPGREARMRAALMARRAERDAQPQSRLGRLWRSFLSNLSWQQSVDANSKPLAVFTWPRVLTRTVIDSVLVFVAVGVLVSLLMAMGVFGDARETKRLFEEFEQANSGWADYVLGAAMVAVGSWLLALARRFAPWVNHASNAAIALVLVGHIGVAVAAAAFTNSVPGLPWVTYMNTLICLACALPPIQHLLARTRAIDAERRSQEERERIAAEGQRALAIADLKALQAQIEPHFLYNTLANLQLLIRHDAGKADAMAGHLIDYLRARLPAMRAPTTSLAQELDMVASYLALLQIRMGQRLQFSIDLPSDCAQAQVPPLAVMTLVENAIQHGLEPKRGGGSVQISAARDGEWLSVQVADTGVGLGASPRAGSGVGLGNVRERLRLMHGPATDASGQTARVDLSANEPCGTRAALHLPFISAETPSQAAPSA